MTRPWRSRGRPAGSGAPRAPGSRPPGTPVIGVDVRDAEVIADLSTPDGRAAMVDGVTERHAAARSTALVAAAGVTHDDGRLVTAINYFGAIATLDGLRPLLAGRPGAQRGGRQLELAPPTQPGLPLELVDACLAGDEDAALAVAGPRHRRVRGDASWRWPGGCAARP